MKKLVILSFIFTGSLLAQDATDSSGREVLENSDMSDSTTHWHGNAKAAGADLSTDLVTEKSGGSNSISVDLKPTTWSKVTQEIHGLKLNHGRGGSLAALPPMKLTIVYQTSPDFILSTKPIDYEDIGTNLDFEKIKIRGQAGQLMAFVDYPVGGTARNLSTGGLSFVQMEKIAVAYFAPKTDQQPQTYTNTLNLAGINNTSDVTFCLAFPPGTGRVTLTKISLTEIPPQLTQQ